MKKRKDYLKEKLSKEEKVYLKRVIMSARDKYIRKNYQYINATVSLNEDILVADNSIIDDVIEKCINEIKSAEEFEKALSDPELYKYVKALSLKEKEVLFYLFWRPKQVNEVGQIMKLHRNTIERKRDKVLDKILEKMLKGGEKNV